MTICAFDITPDAVLIASVETPPEAGYRWVHFDLSDADLTGFLDAHVPPIPAAALVAPETRPRADRYGDGLILNLRGVNMNEDGPADQMVAVRMWVTAQLVVTVRMRKVFALDEMRVEAEAGHAPGTPMRFVSALATRLMGRVQDTVFDLSGRVDAMEDSVQDDDQPLPTELAEERRMAIRLRRYLAPQRDALVALVGTDSPLMSQGTRDLLREQANLAKLNVEELEGLIARMTAVQDHHTAQAALLQGHNGYVLSIVAAVFLPLGFVTGLFGVNVAGMPGIETPWAFAALCAALVVMTVGAVWVLRRLKWI
ncbi:zinc transporter ZntB [Tateyamaria omphalii]|uniref:zinc transporter ZntB n=1 Tax=Tateyamaria omphalii TaxID=299262 RepID=UPI001C99FEA9|nr:zinc transporter ZntB [Tateyamaria omphalii]MBY5935382.1 zinc transporter ZntB [Tateyamaria omphalii]